MAPDCVLWAARRRKRAGFAQRLDANIPFPKSSSRAACLQSHNRATRNIKTFPFPDEKNILVAASFPFYHTLWACVALGEDDFILDLVNKFAPSTPVPRDLFERVERKHFSDNRKHFSICFFIQVLSLETQLIYSNA